MAAIPRMPIDRSATTSDPEVLSGLSWSNSKWSPQQINPGNVLEYFSDRSNPFYDCECNNEMLRMQRLNMEQLINMVGVEYCLHSSQEPILYILCKQHRRSPTQVTPLAMYYIINGVVHQCPDLASLINSRLLTTLYHLNSGFQEVMSCARYHPTNGTYSWAGSDKSATAATSITGPISASNESASYFQRHRVDMLLADWSARFPAPEMPGPPPAAPPPVAQGSGTIGGGGPLMVSGLGETGGAPAEKKMKTE